MAKRPRPKPKMTVAEQAAELAKIDAELNALQAQQIALSERRQAPQDRRALVNTQLIRERLQGSLGEFVKLTGNGFYLVPTRRLKPQPGDIGRLLKIGRTRTLIDFGEELHTWYITLQGVGKVTDPLTLSADDLFEARMFMEGQAELEEEMDNFIAGPDELPDEDKDDEERRNDDLSV